MIRAIVSQFIPHSKAPLALIELWKAKKKGKETPKTSDLVETLQKMWTENDQRTYFIVLDALDEALDAERDDLLEILQAFSSWDTVDLHVLVSSRTNTTGVLEALRELKGFINVEIERKYVNADILAHIRERLQNDTIMKAWPLKERQKVENSLVEKAEGM